MRPTWDAYYHPTGHGQRGVTGLDEWRALVGRTVEFTTTDGWDDYRWHEVVESVAMTRTEYGWPRIALHFGEGGGLLVEPNRSYMVTVHPDE